MIILDTHVWVWWIGGEGCAPLSNELRERMQEAEVLGISAISCVEVAWLVAAGRLVFDRDPLVWIQQTLARPRVALLDITAEIAVRAANLQWSNKDPADRLIVATALTNRAPLATKDERMRAFRPVETIW